MLTVFETVYSESMPFASISVYFFEALFCVDRPMLNKPDERQWLRHHGNLYKVRREAIQCIVLHCPQHNITCCVIETLPKQMKI